MLTQMPVRLVEARLDLRKGGAVNEDARQAPWWLVWAHGGVAALERTLVEPSLALQDA
jgi:hypothetical protein